MIKSSALAAILASLLLHSAAVAEQAPLRIGLVYCFSGPFAVAGAQASFGWSNSSVFFAVSLAALA